MNLAVTVTASRSPRSIALARAAAKEWGVPYVERPKRAAIHDADETPLIVFGPTSVKLVDPAGSLMFTPGMAKLRLKRIEAGADEDLLLRLGEVAEGDSFLDCTFGLGADALVAARAVGRQGKVVGLEKSLALYALAAGGLRVMPPDDRSAPIEVLHRDAAEYLRKAPAKSFDVVFFDPMFERPKSASPAFEVLRRYASYSPLTPEMLADARRVARRWVVVKAPRYGPELDRLGLTPEKTSPYSPVWWARVSRAD